MAAPPLPSRRAAPGTGTTDAADGRRRLFLHVGTHKTGTTSVQAFLAQEGPRLARAGLHAYEERPGADHGSRCNAYELAHAVLRAEVVTPMRAKARLPSGASAKPQAFARWLDGRPQGDVVVSSEAFCFLRTEQEADALRALLDPLFATVRPLVTLRREEDWRRSWRSELERAGLAGRLATLAQEERPDGDWYFDRDALLGFWSRIGDPVPIDYDDAVARDGSILPAFVRALGLPDFAPKHDYRLNVTRGPSWTRGPSRSLRGALHLLLDRLRPRTETPRT